MTRLLLQSPDQIVQLLIMKAWVLIDLGNLGLAGSAARPAALRLGGGAGAQASPVLQWSVHGLLAMHASSD